MIAVAKGLDLKGPNAPADVYRDVPARDMRVPSRQLVYVGDGGSDMPVFRMVNARNCMRREIIRRPSCLNQGSGILEISFDHGVGRPIGECPYGAGRVVAGILRKHPRSREP